MRIDPKLYVAPVSSQILAASRISSGTEPKSWIAIGRSAGHELTSWSAFGLRSISDRAKRN